MNNQYRANVQPDETTITIPASALEAVSAPIGHISRRPSFTEGINDMLSGAAAGRRESLVCFSKHRPWHNQVMVKIVQDSTSVTTS